MIDLRPRLQAALGDAYDLDRELGGGGMSRVFLATERSLHRQVVVKVLPPELASEVSEARFKQEIELAAHLQHTNILPVLAAGAKDDLLFYVMPFVSGESLRHRLTREGKLPVVDAVRIVQEVADALAYAHAEGVIHRDIKPENILLLGAHAVLTDFGVARALAEARSGERLTETGMSVGTPGYMSPEQVAGDRQIDGRADVYALAVVGYEMLAGVPPFEGPTAQAVLAAHLTKTAKPLVETRPEVPVEVSVAIAQALEKDPSQRLHTAAELRDALGAVTRTAVRPVVPRRARLVPIVAAVLVAVAASVYFVLRSRTAAGLDANLIAVAPFDVLDPKLTLWKEGLVDVLSRNLDGAGPLRTVSPTVVVRRWTGRADPASAAELGRRTGAKLVVFGQLVATRGDSVRLTASLLDVGTSRSVAEVEVRNLADNMDLLGDSLTVTLLRELGRSRPIGAVRLTALSSTSLPALRAYLTGEQHFRRTAWDSALASYQRAVTLDSGFALAWSRMGTVIGWQVIGGDSLSSEYALRAARLNHDLPPRESLLITVDSLSAALFAVPADPNWRALRARMFATLQGAARRYPEDPEIRYQVGDADLHFRRVGQTTLEQQLRDFARAIELDSAFGEPYLHAISLAVQLDRSTEALRYLKTYIALNPDEQRIDAMRIAVQVLENPGRDARRRIDSLVQAASAPILFDTYLSLQSWPDSAQSAVQVTKALVASRPSGFPLFDDPAFRTGTAANALAFRGRLREAYAVGGQFPGLVSGFAPLSNVGADSMAHVFQRWLRDPRLEGRPSALPYGFNLSLFNALPWWAARRDTVSLAAFASRLGSLLRAATTTPNQRTWLSYGTSAAGAYLALARGDSAMALGLFDALPDTVCPCAYEQITHAELLSARGKNREALAVFDNQFPTFNSPVNGLWRLERGRVAERAGERERAIEDYRFVANVWRFADPELQPYVAEAKAALTRLNAEPR